MDGSEVTKGVVLPRGRMQWQRFASGVSPLDRWLTYGAAAAVLSSAIAVSVLVAAGNTARDYRPGDRFETAAGFDPSRSSASIVIFLRTTCGACQDSAAVFRQIARRPRQFHVAIVGYEGEDLLRQFVEGLGIDADTVLSVPVGSIRLTAVPRVVLLDHGGVVRSIWSDSLEIASATAEILASARALGEGGGQ